MDDFIKLLQVPLVITVVTLIVTTVIDIVKNKIKYSETEKNKKIKLEVNIIGNKKTILYDVNQEEKFSFDPETGPSRSVVTVDTLTVLLDVMLTNKSSVNVHVYNITLKAGEEVYLMDDSGNHRVTPHISGLLLPFTIAPQTNLSISLTFDIKFKKYTENGFSAILEIGSTNGDSLLKVSDFKYDNTVAYKMEYFPYD